MVSFHLPHREPNAIRGQEEFGIGSTVLCIQKNQLQEEYKMQKAEGRYSQSKFAEIYSSYPSVTNHCRDLQMDFYKTISHNLPNARLAVLLTM